MLSSKLAVRSVVGALILFCLLFYFVNLVKREHSISPDLRFLINIISLYLDNEKLASTQVTVMIV